MSVVVVVPWRAGCPHREAAWGYLQKRLAELGWPHTAGGTTPFNRAGSKNAGARAAVAHYQADVLVMHDADMLIPVEQYHRLQRKAQRTGCLTVGFRTYRPLDEHATRAVIEGGADPFTTAPMTEHTDFSLGGIVAITTEAWAQVGGYDQRFTGWGLEDTAFAVACSRILGPTQRVNGPAVHLWHPHATSTEGMGIDNAGLLRRYNEAVTPGSMRRLLEEPGGPLG